MSYFSLRFHWRDMLLAVALGCFIGSWFLIYAAWPMPEPNLWTKTTTIDLGDVYQQQEKAARFEFVNHFPMDVEIVEVVKGCSCSDASLTKKHLKPREKTVLEVTWRTGHMRGRSAVDVILNYKLENGAELYKVLRIEANVIPDIRYEPEQVAFDGKKPETQSIRLWAGRMSHFVVVNARSNHPAFKARIRGNDAVEVTFDGKTPVYANGLDPILILETDSPKEPRIYVPLKARSRRPTQ